jgi:hypothetical protein
MEEIIKGYSFDIITNTLKITEKFEKRAGMVGTPEYQALLQLRKDYPELKIERNPAPAKDNTHKDLKTSFMIARINESLEKKTINGRLVKDELAEIDAQYKDSKGYFGKIKKLYFDTYPDKARPKTNENKAKKLIKTKKELAESLKKLQEAQKQTETMTVDVDNTNNGSPAT